MQEFIAYLLKGLSVVAMTLSSITFTIYNATVTLTDLVIYSNIIMFTLALIDKLNSSKLLYGMKGSKRTRKAE